jgi:hypothetical protein
MKPLTPQQALGYSLKRKVETARYAPQLAEGHSSKVKI